MKLKTKQLLFATSVVLFFLLMVGMANALSPYYGITQSTTTGRAAGHISGTWGVAASSQAPSAYGVFLDGVNARVGIGVASPSYPLDLNGYGVLKSSAVVYGTLGVGYNYGNVPTTSKLNINANGGYAIGLYSSATSEGLYLFPSGLDLYLRTTGGAVSDRRFFIGNGGSSYGGLSLNIYGGDQGSYPGIALRGAQTGAMISVQNGSTTGHYGGFSLYSANSNGGMRMRVWQSDTGSTTDRWIMAPDTGNMCFGCTSELQALYRLQVSSGTFALAGTGAKIRFADGTEQTTAGVASSRAINTTAPLAGGGNLSADRTLSISSAGATSDGYLKADDWNTFNNKQPAGSYRLTTDPVDWTDLQNYPSACSAGEFVTTIGDTLTCAVPAGGGDALVASDNNWSATQTFQSSATVKGAGGLGVTYGVAASTVATTSTATLAAISVTGAASFSSTTSTTTMKYVNIANTLTIPSGGVIDAASIFISSTCAATSTPTTCTVDCQNTGIGGAAGYYLNGVPGYFCAAGGAPYGVGFGGTPSTQGILYYAAGCGQVTAYAQCRRVK